MQVVTFPTSKPHRRIANALVKSKTKLGIVVSMTETPTKITVSFARNNVIQLGQMSDGHYTVTRSGIVVARMIAGVGSRDPDMFTVFDEKRPLTESMFSGSLEQAKEFVIQTIS